MKPDMRLAQFAKLACSALLFGSPLLGQLQFFNPASDWLYFPPAIATDSAGNTYVVSKSGDYSSGLTATKLDSARRVIYSFSFPQYTSVTSAAVDSKGSLIIGGSASLTNFPLVNPLFYPRLPTSGYDRGFLAKLDPSGQSLLFSTLVGGNELDSHYLTSVTAVSVDSADRIYAAGSTSSPTFPVSANAFQKTGGGPSGINTSGFLMRISSAGDALQFSTYLGGSAPGCQNCRTQPNSLIVDGQGIATISGASDVMGFPVTKGAYNCGCATVPNVFVSRFNADASALQWSTLLPGGFAYRLSVDRQGNATVAGTTADSTLQATTGALQTASGVTAIPPSYPLYGSEHDTGFLSTISSDGTTLLHATYYGGSSFSTLSGMVQDPDGNFWISGEANSADLPMPAGSLNLGAGYLAELDPQLTHVLRYYGIPRGVGGQTLNILPNRDLVLSGVANSVVTIPSSGPTGPSVWAIAGAAEPAATPHISPGEVVAIYGVQLGPAAGVSGSLDGAGRIATSLAGYRVLVNGIPAPLLYAGAHQINMVVPFGTATGIEASLQVVAPEGPLTAVRGIAVGPSEPQIFPVIVNQDGGINSQTHPAPRNSIVTAWATGGGAMDQGMLDGQVNQSPLGKVMQPLSVELSRLGEGDAGEVTYAGAAPGMVAGVLQVNFRVPTSHSGYGTCHSLCDVVLIIGGRGSLAPFSFSVFNTPDPILWVVD
jgi:uncharacterized protein (TIGR03437 family)